MAPLPVAEKGNNVRAIYERLDATYRNETWHWYPEHIAGPMDVVAGSILVQHTNWQNAERALDAMRAAGAIDSRVLATMPDAALVPLIGISGTPTVKARRLRAIASVIEDAGGVDALFSLPEGELRERLLRTHGIGAETADAIMLYAAGRRVFVIDSYTQRMFRRIGMGPAVDSYDAWQDFFEDALPGGDVTVFQRYHAYIVLHSKAICRATPRCPSCPLRDQCETGRQTL